MLEFFTTNQFVTAVANFSGIIAALLIAIKIVSWTVNFGKNLYRSNIKTVIFVIKRRSYRTSIKCSSDIHFYVAYLSRHAAMTFLLLIGFILIGSMDYSTVSSEEYSKIGDKIFFDNYHLYKRISDFIEITASFFLFIYFIFAVFSINRVMRVSKNVTKLRAKWRKRGVLVDPLYAAVVLRRPN